MKEISIQFIMNTFILTTFIGAMTIILREEIREERDVVVNEYYVCQGDTMLVDIIVY